MSDTPASIHLTSFNCPHCHALAQQFWWETHCTPFKKDEHPSVWTEEGAQAWLDKASKDPKWDGPKISDMKEYLDKLTSGEVTAAESTKDTYVHAVDNLWLSKCYACDRIAVWIYNRLVHPVSSDDVPPINSDAPIDVQRDYAEAAAILNSSPRGSAALLRLAIQKLLKFLECKGKDINDDIAELVQKGLDQRIQMSLDIVRVVGNHAVHPGQIDLRDDKKVASTLFNLVNVIVDAMISQPKHIATIYGSLPEGARKAIENRDKPK